MEKEKKDIKKIRKELDKNRDNLEINSKEIKGYGPAISQMIDPQISDINFDQLSITNNKTISSNLFNIRGRDQLSKEEISEILYSQISNLNNLSQDGIEDLITGQRHLYKEYEVLSQEMPEIKEAIKRMANDVVNPNGAGLSGLKISFYNNNENREEEKYHNLIKYFRPLEDISSTLSARRLYSYDLEEEVKKRIRNCLTYGCAVVVTIPYSAIANDLLYDAHKRNQSMGESYIPFSEDKSFYYNDFQKDVIDRLQNAYEHKMDEQKKAVAESLTASGESYLLNEFIEEGSDYGHGFVDNNFYGQAEVDELSMIIEKESKDLVEENKAYTMGNDMVDLLARGEANEQELEIFTNQEFANLQEIKEKRKMKFNIDKIKGCTTEFLDVKRMLPLFIKDELMGVIMIREENEFSNQRLGQSLKMLLSPEQVNSYVTTGGAQSYKDKLRKIIIEDMGRTLQRNISKKLLRNNPTLIEDIEYLLDEVEIDSLLKSRLRFVPGEFITLFKVGDGKMGTSIIEESKPYIHAVIHLQKNRMLHEILLNKDRWMFKFPHSNDAAGLTRVMEALKLFRATMPTLEHVANADVINNTLSARSVILVPQLPGGNEDLFTIEKLDQTTFNEPNDELLNKLRNSATAPFGYPADTLDPNSNVDFAKKLAQLNINTLMMVLNYQKLFTLPISEECTRRLRYMTGNDKLEMIVEFDPPRELNDVVISESLNQVDTLATVYEKLIDENPSIEEENKGIAKYYLRENLLKGLLDLQMIEEVKEKYVTEGVPSPEDVNT